MKSNYLLILLMIALVALTSCSSSEVANDVKTIQEEAIDVVEASENGASPEDILDEVEDVIEQLPADGAEASQSSFEGYGMTYVINGERFTNEEAVILGDTPVAGFLTVTSPDSLGVQLRMLPNEVGVYEAGQGPSQYRLVDVWFPHEGKRYVADGSRGEASITLTEVGELAWPYQGDVAGSFSGTFVADDGSEIIVTEGEFKGTGQ